MVDEDVPKEAKQATTKVLTSTVVGSVLFDWQLPHTFENCGEPADLAPALLTAMQNSRETKEDA